MPILDGEACIPYSVTTTKIGDFTVNVNNLDNDIHNFAGCAIELNIRGNEEGKFKMSLVFRWYLGLSSRWARQGEVSRKKDFQIWSG